MQAESSPNMWTDGFKIVVLMAFEFFPRTGHKRMKKEEKNVLGGKINNNNIV